MKTVKIKFNNIESQSFKALKNKTANVISYKLVVNDVSLPTTVGRVETRLDKASRDESQFSIFDIDLENGIAVIHYDESKVDQSKDLILNKSNTRIFINALTVNGEITAITGFTASEVYL